MNHRQHHRTLIPGVLLIAILLPLALLTGCHAESNKAAPANSADSTESTGSTDSTAPPAALPVVEYTDLTSLVLADEGRDAELGRRLLTAALCEDDSLLALYRDLSPSHQGIHAEKIRLADGSRELCAKWDLEEDSNWTIVSTDPLIVYSIAEGILCMEAPDAAGDPVIAYVPDRLIGSTLAVCSGRIWLSSFDGFVYEVSRSGEFSLHWTLPHNFSSINPVPNADPNVLSYTSFEESDPQRAVRLDYDPAGDQYEVYTSADDDIYIEASGDGFLASINDTVHPVITLYDIDASMQYRLDFDNAFYGILSKDNLFLTIPDQFVTSSGCLFFLCDSDGLPVNLYLWNYSSALDAEPWAPAAHEPFAGKSVTDYGALTQKAEELEQNYGISIVLGENVPTVFDNYSAAAYTGTPVISSVLTMLEETFSLYPDNYFFRLKEDCYRGITIYLTGSLTPLDPTQNIADAAAFTSVQGGQARIAIDIDAPVTGSTVIHELTHVLDDRMIREGWLTEEEWSALNPPGFDYYYSYIDENGGSYAMTGDPAYTARSGAAPEETYFVDRYSKTFPTEDRARIMEYYLSDREKVDPGSAEIHLLDKYSYYTNIIWEHLHDDSWPEDAFLPVRSPD